jgi:hypothetical protein
MTKILRLFFLPPMATARLGGSDTPLDSFTWIEDPTIHGAGQTAIAPSTSLEVLADGSVRPNLPAAIQFRDGTLLRPTAPFFELWALLEGASDIQPLTTAMLQDAGGSLAGVAFTVTAANRKAARRTGNETCAFSARIQVAGDDHDPHPLLASSIGDANTPPLVSPDRPIPLGTFRVIRPVATIALGVDLSVLRVRFTPATGQVYGPPAAVDATEPEFPNRQYELVSAANRILNQDSPWFQYTYTGNTPFNNPEPSDTYDGADDSRRNNLSFGVVDDTCDVLLEAAVVAAGARFQASARVFVGPPDFAPDRRPFFSLADELIDRDPPAVDPPETTVDKLDRLADLFQRVFETVSLANIDAMRDRSIGGGQDGGTATDRPRTNDDSMTPRDTLYYRPDQPDIGPSTIEDRLPFARTGVDHHAPLAQAESLALFLHDNADLVRVLIRPPYGAFKDLAATVRAGDAPNPDRRDPRVTRDTLYDMRMPPYMRDETGSPLSLTRRQYAFLMSMVKQFAATAATEPMAQAARKGKTAPKGTAAAPAAKVKAPSTRAQAHVARVVDRRKGKPPL